MGRTKPTSRFAPSNGPGVELPPARSATPVSPGCRPRVKQPTGRQPAPAPRKAPTRRAVCSNPLLDGALRVKDTQARECDPQEVNHADVEVANADAPERVVASGDEPDAELVVAR